MPTSTRPQLFLILHDIRSVLNVGSIFRTADAAGVKKIYLTGYTPSPIDRFGRVRADFHKAALGAEHSVEWEQVPDVFAVFNKLRGEGAALVAVEQDTRAVSYTAYKLRGATAFVFGNEPDGLPVEVIDRTDDIIEIPMHGKKESLNVAVAAGIILFHFRNQKSS